MLLYVLITLALLALPIVVARSRRPRATPTRDAHALPLRAAG
jgi:hypothetical protein